MIGGYVVERKTHDGSKQGVKNGSVHGRLRAFQTTMTQFGDDHRTDSNFSRIGRTIAHRDLWVLVPKNCDPDGRVEEINHSMSTGGGIGGCG